SPKYYILGTCEEMILNHISYFLDIYSPSATIYTAYSLSYLQLGKLKIAITSSVSMIISPNRNIHLNNLGFLNPKGYLRAFNVDANSYRKGKEYSILILKKLNKALIDSNLIRVVI
ncbi:hypothetical protein CC80DRAFT_397031, partial [Byssothecium circinans]